MKKSIISKLSLAIVSLFLTNLVVAEPVIKFGAILPLSGPGANVGDTCKKSFELKIKDLEESNEESLVEIILLQNNFIISDLEKY